MLSKQKNLYFTPKQGLSLSCAGPARRSMPCSKKRVWRDSNPRHMVPETIALSPELQMRIRETFTLLTFINNNTSALVCKESCSLKLLLFTPFPVT